MLNENHALAAKLEEQNNQSLFPETDRALFSRLLWHTKDAKPVAFIFRGAVAHALMEQESYHGKSSRNRHHYFVQATDFLDRASRAGLLVKTHGVKHVADRLDKWDIAPRGIDLLMKDHPSVSKWHLFVKDVGRSWKSIAAGIGATCTVIAFLFLSAPSIVRLILTYLHR